MKYYSENQVKKLLLAQINECETSIREMRLPTILSLPKGKEGNVYSYKQIDEIRNYDAFQFEKIDFHLD